MKHTGYNDLDSHAQAFRYHNQLAMLDADLVYNHVRFSPDGLRAATLQVMSGGC